MAGRPGAALTDWDALLRRAIGIAEAAHAGQLDRYGRPYLLHPLRLMRRAGGPEAKVVAVLHDVVEDSATSLDDLRHAGFPERVVAAVDALTRRPGEPYDEAVERAARDRLAREVKRLDLEDNMDLRRIPDLGQVELERLRRYHRAWLRLGAAAGAGGLADRRSDGIADGGGEAVP